MESKKYITLGSPQENISYKQRPAAYGIAFSKTNKISLIKIDGYKFHLIGGGIEDGETPEAALQRECLEEVGYQCEVKDFLGQVNNFYYSNKQQQYFKKEGLYYVMKLEENMSAVPLNWNHELVWVDAREVLSYLRTDSAKWAVRAAVKSILHKKLK